MAVCAQPGCPAIVKAGRCAKHQRPAWAPSAPVTRIRGRKLQALRTRLFASEPWCRACRARGLWRLAEVRDHVEPLSEGGTDAPENIQPLCQQCSDEKTAQEAQRGRRRAAW
jgi:5-methylcytosine-specific restriction protein A